MNELTKKIEALNTIIEREEASIAEAKNHIKNLKKQIKKYEQIQEQLNELINEEAA